MKMKIIVNDVQNDYVTIIDPEGNEVVTTNNELVYNDIRLQIARNSLEGYKLKYKDKLYEIDAYGYANAGVFSKLEEQLSELLRLKFGN